MKVFFERQASPATTEAVVVDVPSILTSTESTLTAAFLVVLRGGLGAGSCRDTLVALPFGTFFAASASYLSCSYNHGGEVRAMK